MMNNGRPIADFDVLAFKHATINHATLKHATLKRKTDKHTDIIITRQLNTKIHKPNHTTVKPMTSIK